MPAAKTFLVAQTCVGAATLLGFNLFAVLTALASLLIVAIYPFMKRITSWPQAVLGLAFAWGGLMGWAAAFGSLAPAGAADLCRGDLLDHGLRHDLRACRTGATTFLPASARRHGCSAITCAPGVGILYLGAILLALLAIGTAGGGIIADLGLLAFALHLAWQTRRLALPDPATALMLFRSNRDAGLILFAGLALDELAKAAFG